MSVMREMQEGNDVGARLSKLLDPVASRSVLWRWEAEPDSPLVGSLSRVGGERGWACSDREASCGLSASPCA
jgi:hypothetical protein